jgi:hypothetical protein
MSDYGLLQEVRISYRGSTLAAAAAVSDTELVVEYAGDFNYDPENPDDTGGTLDLNGARLAYTAVTYGELPEDPDTIILAEPLTVAADVDDFVGVVAGGQVLEDWEAYVTMDGGGDQVVARLSVDQRAQWPIGVYPDPVPVVLSDDLLHIEDAPGRTVSSRVQFLNTDEALVPSDGADVPIPLSFTPIPGSERVSFRGQRLRREDWSRTDDLLTIPGEPWFRTDDRAWVDYAYDGAAARVGPGITSPFDGEAVTDTTPTITGTAPASRSVEVFVDGASAGTVTSDSSGTWSLVSAALATGEHTITATQTEPDGSELYATPVVFTVVTDPAAFVSATSVIGDHTSIPLPAGTVAGDMLVLVISARVTATPTDSRFPDPGFTDTMGGFGAAGVWVGTADGSGTDVSIDMVSAGVGDPADGAAALMAIHGIPLDLTADQTSVTDPAGTNPFTPAVAGSAAFGIAALFAVSGISSGSISEQTTNWTLRKVQQGGGAGKCSVYLGTAAGIPSGTWETNGSTIIGGARIMGVQ